MASAMTYRAFGIWSKLKRATRRSCVDPRSAAVIGRPVNQIPHVRAPLSLQWIATELTMGRLVLRPPFRINGLLGNAEVEAELQALMSVSLLVPPLVFLLLLRQVLVQVMHDS